MDGASIDNIGNSMTCILFTYDCFVTRATLTKTKTLP